VCPELWSAVVTEEKQSEEKEAKAELFIDLQRVPQKRLKD
jgi:hypothetical protein